VSHALARVREAARTDRTARFTALLHHVTLDRLGVAYRAINPSAASGVDEVTWQEYGRDLKGNLGDLHGRIHRGSYRAKPSRRTYPAGNASTGALNSLTALATDGRDIPVARATALTPPWPASRASTPSHSRRCRSSRYGDNAANLGPIASSSTRIRASVGDPTIRQRYLV
jgi:hypothetical protein